MITDSDLYVFGGILLTLLIFAFGVTLVEFIEMDKNPKKYKNPNYGKKKKSKK